MGVKQWKSYNAYKLCYMLSVQGEESCAEGFEQKILDLMFTITAIIFW